MSGLYNYIIRRFHRLFFLSAAIFVLLMPVMLQDMERLSTEAAPKGIISLELAWTYKRANAIKESWKSCLDSSVLSDCRQKSGACCTLATGQFDEKKCSTTLYEVALYDIGMDYLFVFAYCLMLLVLLSRVNDQKGRFLGPPGSPFANDATQPITPLKNHVRILMIAVLLIGGMDYMENILMDLYLNDRINYGFLFSLPATIKFILLLFVGLYLLWRLFNRMMKSVSDYLHTLISILWEYRIITISLVILYGILWLSDQGQDILLMQNTELYGPPIFLSSISVLALLHWHLPKHFTDRAKRNAQTAAIFTRKFLRPGMHDDTREKNVARVLGVMTFLLPACGIWNAMQQFDIHFILEFINPYVLLLVSVLFFALLFRSDVLIRFWEKGPERAFHLLVIFYIVSSALIVAPVFNPQRHAPTYLIYLVLDLYLLAGIFATFVVLHGKIAERFRKPLPSIGVLITLSGLVLTLFYLVLNFEPFLFSEYSRYLTISIVVAGMVAYNILFSLLLLVGRWLKMDLVLLIIVIGFVLVISGPNEFHNVRTISHTNTAAGFIKRESLLSFENYLNKWLEHRRDSIMAWKQDHSAARYPLFIVNAYGGGIRAAAWTSMVISYLDTMMKENGRQPFQHYVLAYSGASGGTIGASVMCAHRHKGRDSILSDQDIFKIYAEDYLTPVLIGLQGRDIWCAPFRSDRIKDRAEFQETAWEKHLSDSRINYSKSYFSLWYDPIANNAFEVPLLFSNTYNVDDGKKGILAPVVLPKQRFPGANFINDLYGANENLRLSTAAFLSARFPYISPTARFSGGLHFLDGGLKENSGAETATQLYRLIEAIKVADTASMLKYVDIYILSVRNTFENAEPDNKAENIAEMTAPLTGLINNFVGSSIQADSINQFLLDKRYYSIHPHRFCIKRRNDNESIRPVLPLGWQISDLALQGMRQSLGECPESLDSILVKVFKCDQVKLNRYRESLKEWPEQKK